MPDTAPLHTDGAAPPALRLCPSSAGVDVVDTELVERVVEDLNRVDAAAHLSLCRSLGEILLQSLYGGDLDAFLQIGRDHASLRAVLAHRGLRPSSSLAWYSLNLLPQLRSFGDVLSEALPMAHHRILMHVRDEQLKLDLARRAVVERMSKRELEAEVEAWRRAEELERGRRRPGRPKLLRVALPTRTEAAPERPKPGIHEAIGNLLQAAALARDCPIDREAVAKLHGAALRRAITLAQRALDDLDEFLDEVEQALDAR